MGIFSKILGKIFPFDHPAVTSAGTGTPPIATSAPGAAAAQASATAGAAAAAAETASVTGALVSTPSGPPVDVEAVLSRLAATNPGPANWRTSIVDLLKLLDLDSDLASRKDLAKELGYTGDTGDSATMNVWLHKQVMARLAANGGKVPADLKD